MKASMVYETYIQVNILQMSRSFENTLNGE